ncbi:putative 2-aminoethylphosphonate ABC transporter permease subunit [Paenibacillus sp. GCM10023248]|uniref:putative 2-aminoethylphosphonate ABC transporter permease subunit n=1 Tax=unclassified Paenibacillus TaxID=185978 RepID=UPI002378E28C|nr:putative 2-aminoethylphosphonate ABC transporter permease subunit [Paenibacillus sp. MAHUQ-63]MDD9265885.1 putative 2-aminoethylphosphonate ABC transporter permease subunit [Paenibacillus sp. MAHUQ-63]
MSKAAISMNPPIRRRFGALFTLQNGLILLLVATLLVSTLIPLLLLFSKALLNKHGEYTGIANFITYFSTPSLLQSLTNTVWISALSTVLAVSLAFLYAYGVSRTGIRGKSYLRYVALLPLFEPTMMHGIALTYLFGNQGMVTHGFFGLLPGVRVPIYGPVGIIISEVIYLFPQAFLIFITALSMTDQRLYEAAESLGAKKWKTFVTVTIPSVKYGLISAIFVCFTASFTDFGAPQAIGGKFNVLATDIYKQVIGQQNLPMGATVGILLTVPAVIAFIVDRIVASKQRAMLSSKSTPYRIPEGRDRDRFYSVFCLLVSVGILVPLATIVFASLVNVWPYHLTLGFKHYNFSSVAGSGLEPFWNSIRVAFVTAVAGTVMTFVFAYIIEKMRSLKLLRQFGYFLSILPLALPGMVIGLAYIFFFNEPGNPLHWMYGTMAIIVLANITHYYAVPFITATTALKKLDKDFELVSESMRVPLYRTFLRVTVPMSMPAIIEMAMYFFVNAMVTVSAVVFLRSADMNLAAVALVNMEDAGDVAAAAAMSTLIVVTNIVVRLGYELILKRVKKGTAPWQTAK